MSQDQSAPSTPPSSPEPEHTGVLWKHPYVVYILLTLVLFLGLILIGWLALENGWIPNRGLGEISVDNGFRIV